MLSVDKGGMDWCEVTVETTPEGADIAAQALYEADAQGVIVEDGKFEMGPDDDYIDESLIRTTKEDKAFVKAFFKEDEYLADRLHAIKERLCALAEMDLGLNLGSLAVSTGTVKETDWSENWKKYYKPFKAGRHIVVKPTWEAYSPNSGETVIELDPGMAFGTGTHETTRMCVEYIEEYVMEGASVLDVGCGSGILAVAAAKCGAKSVLALDRDPVSVRTAEENIALNGCTDAVKAKASDLLGSAGDFTADVVVANIIADIIIRLTPAVAGHLKADGVYITSGIIASRLDDVTDALAANGYTVLGIKEMGEWRAVAAKRA
jgi:ribosomal protein L11 methyltransferase